MKSFYVLLLAVSVAAANAGTYPDTPISVHRHDSGHGNAHRHPRATVSPDSDTPSVTRRDNQLYPPASPSPNPAVVRRNRAALQQYEHEHQDNDSNAERMARGLPLIPPTRRSEHKLYARASASPEATTSRRRRASMEEYEKQHSDHDTNAERMANGMPPLPPTRRSVHQLHARASASPMPAAGRRSVLQRRRTQPREVKSGECRQQLSSTTGVVKVTSADDHVLLGYIGKDFNRQRSYTLIKDINMALTVSVPSKTSFYAPIDIKAVGGPDETHPFLAAVARSSADKLGTANSNYAYLSGAGESKFPLSIAPVYSSFSSSTGSSMDFDSHAESQIFTLSCADFPEISASWTNPNGEYSDITTMFYNPTDDFLGLTGDVDAFNKFSGEDAHAVTLTFIPMH